VAAAIPARFKGRARRDAAAFYLSELAKGILSGELMLLSGQHETVIATAEFVILEIDVKQRKRANRVEVTLRWPARPLIRTASAEGARNG
jgi:amphi-Trp domain-containing protein